MTRVSAVLLNYRRAHHMPRIVESLRQHEFVDDITIFNNGDPLEIEGANVIGVGRNVVTYGRFLAVNHAKHSVIFTQDDDVVVRNVPQLFSRFLSQHKKPFLQLGWGSVFNRDWIHVLNRWIDCYGEDELLCRKADRIFTTLYGAHDPIPGDFERLTDPVTGRDSDRDAHSLWLRDDHKLLTNTAVEKALALRDGSA